MIIIKLQGGLGNQLFQWALSKSMSKSYSEEIFLDISFYDNQKNVTKRNFDLLKFTNLKKPIYKKKENCLIINDNFHYKKFNYDKTNSYYFDGYWQSEKYFLNARNLILDELKPSDFFLNKITNFSFNNSVSLHIRRGDYLFNKDKHPVQNLEYYNNALDLIGKYENLYIFSDDMLWCKENLKYKKMIFVEGQENFEDIWFMSRCTHNIIANSSFSWWGAWLNENKNKKIVAPKKWFGNNLNLNTSEIIPIDWYVI